MRISSYVDWVRAERQLVRALGAQIKRGWVACDNRQKEEGHKFWYNASGRLSWRIKGMSYTW